MKLYSLGQWAKDVRRFGEISVLDVSSYEQVNVHMKRVYGQSSTSHTKLYAEVSVVDVAATKR